MENWVLLQKGADFEHLTEKFGISPILARLIRNRDVVGDEAVGRYLSGTMADTYDGRLMKDMDVAVKILSQKIGEGRHIRVIGDYDIDGVCSTYVLLCGLAGLGARPDYDIPDRIVDGYGLNENLVRRAHEAGVDTILTCDNGISATKAVALAKSLGMTVVVTDHHEVPFVMEPDGLTPVMPKQMILPAADAVVDPKRTDSEYPFAGLCGTAVAYKLLAALYEAVGEDAGKLDPLLEEVGFATVGDVMDLTDENRILVKEGLRRLRKTKNLGLKALMQIRGVNPETLNPHDIGFILGPCINASGRLDTARRSLALLAAKDEAEAERIAGELNAFNEDRKERTERQARAALAQVEENGWETDPVLVIYLPDCHESLAGLVASRVRGRYYRPVFVLTDGEELIKGSGRSIESYNMFEGLIRCRDLLEHFGGHAMAAGLSLLPADAGTGQKNLAERQNQVAALRDRLNQTCPLKPEDMEEKVRIDMELPFSMVTKDLIRELELLEPFGNGNPQPEFASRGVTILSARLLGKNRNLLRMRLKDRAGTVLDAICFSNLDSFFAMYNESAQNREMDITFYPELDTYKDPPTRQIVVTHFRFCIASGGDKCYT